MNINVFRRRCEYTNKQILWAGHLQIKVHGQPKNSLFIELKARGFKVEAQKQIKVFYKGYEVGEYYADIVVDDLVILELKAAECMVEEFESQLINYLRGTNMEVGLLLNFGKKPEFIRKVYENKRRGFNMERG